MLKRASVAIGLFVVLALLSVGTASAQDAIRTGEITKLDAAAKSFVVKTARGETQIVTTDATVVKDGDKTIAFADLKVGDHVKITGIRKDAAVEAKEIVKGAAH